MNILLLGSGGREHTMAWKMSQSPLLKQLFICPGNAGTSKYGTNVSVNIDDHQSLTNFLLTEKVDMIVVGPEQPLVEGIHDRIVADEKLKHISVIGPKKEAAELEGSKDFAKQFMQRHHIPTAAYQTFDKYSLEAGIEYLKNTKAPYVLKADGLAAGKGVIILTDLEEAIKVFTEMITEDKFGSAGHQVVIEEFLTGVELSVFVLTDGDSYVLLPEAKDYKRIGEGDTGPNTGGMGSISPVPFADEAYMKLVKERIVEPTVSGLKKDKLDYQGFIFIGLINVNGNPYVIEYNVRMGDPETESVLPRLETDLVELFNGVANRNLGEMTTTFLAKVAASVMLVSGGYPDAYEKGKVITGLEESDENILFHAGTKVDEQNIVSNGGRVLAITSLADTMEDALKASYKKAEKVDFEGKYYRKDLGFDL
ncbi:MULTISPECIES: phosphoribosylamine--glycine ligase [unclassified Lentimicrobium]|uniref:phosphoribosylamine--glycine ligase n=1 Tax=unclassified Lentimicrobium TaxID=2677434 RepID=UPI0015539C5F|nr:MULTISPECIES: phosphoribosylamine--glycine ligase [unclassified Lentimicrobium]NPD46494.1 phosphoribosylamine--glycine ligase [Lentimicrobium sp. S6]NPD86000.1 phosphoribosylamine--glycine ligase [Lentimicrobium sp. L6]